MAVILLLGAGIAYGVTGGASKGPETASASATVAERYSFAPAKPADAVRIKDQNWHTGGFDLVAIANLTVENGNDYPVKDVQFACRYYAPSGTLLTVQTPTAYVTIPPKGKKTLRDFNIGFVHTQARKGGCEVISALRK